MFYFNLGMGSYQQGSSLPTDTLVEFFKPIEGSVGSLDLVVISGTENADWVVTMPDSTTVTDILGVDNDFYTALGVPKQLTWLELQAAATSDVYFYAGLLGGKLYSSDMSAYSAAIINSLGGLYVAPVIVADGWADESGAVWADQTGDNWA